MAKELNNFIMKYSKSGKIKANLANIQPIYGEKNDKKVTPT